MSKQEEVKRIEEELKRLEAEMSYYEQKSPGRDRVTSTQVRIASLSKYLEELKTTE